MHNKFLTRVINHLNQFNRSGQRLIILPTHLSIDYFKAILDQEKCKNRVTCLTLHELILSHSKLLLLPTLTLLKSLHRLSEEILNKQESFEQFYTWGASLLKDFNSIDSYLVNSSDFFASLREQKKLTSLEAIKQAKELSLYEKPEDLFFWKQLPLIYRCFTRKLIEKKGGYKGLCYKMAQPLSEIIATYQELIFVGFNLLTPVEEQFIRQCSLLTLTTFFWDVDSHYLDNNLNIAGHYLRQHREKKWYKESFHSVSYLNNPNKKVFLTEASSLVAQVQAVTVALQEKRNDGKPKFLPSQTAIVVSGSDLLIPLLGQLSSLSIPLHGRLDYPFNATVIYNLVVKWVKVWEKSISIDNQYELCVHLADAFALCYPFVQEAIQYNITLIGELLKNNKWDKSLYQVDGFDVWLNKAHKALLPFLHEKLTYVYEHFIEIEVDHLFLELNKTALKYLLVYIEELLVESSDCSIPFLLNRLKENKIQFHKNNPLTGLYIIEVTESYNLDFENVFFLSMNEGQFPKLTHDDSFIPYDLCTSFGLPLADKVAENKVAYGFYRLLQRAENIYIYYAKKNYVDTTGEMSRLVMQLTFDSNLQIKKCPHSINLLQKSRAVISIKKDHRVIALLNRFLVKEGAVASSLTPSALVTYLSCQLQFYFKYLLQLKETLLAKEASEALQIGTLFHDAMASLYKLFVDREIDTKVIMQLKSKIKTEIDQATATQKKEFKRPRFILPLVERLLERMLDLDDTDTPFTILAIERTIKQPIEINESIINGTIWLSGVIDRIDRTNNLIRISDYKTGLVNNKIASIGNLFDGTNIKKNKAIFQLLFYSWLFKSLHGPYHSQPIMPYLISIRDLFLDDYRPGIMVHSPHDDKKYQYIEDITPYTASFEEGLKRLLLDLFNPATPFIQTEDLTICAYCPYVRICQRD